MSTLAEVKPGQTVRVLEVLGNDSLAARIMEMGIVDDESVKVLGIAPLGDPIEVEVQGYRLSLRKSEASRVAVAEN